MRKGEASRCEGAGIHTWRTDCNAGLKRESSYSSLLNFCLIFFLISLSEADCGQNEDGNHGPGRLLTLPMRIPMCVNALTASCSANVNLACWYSLRRSSSGTPSRCCIYNATMRTLFAFLKSDSVNLCVEQLSLSILTWCLDYPKVAPSLRPDSLVFCLQQSHR